MEVAALDLNELSSVRSFAGFLAKHVMPVWVQNVIMRPFSGMLGVMSPEEGGPWYRPIPTPATHRLQVACMKKAWAWLNWRARRRAQTAN